MFRPWEDNGNDKLFNQEENLGDNIKKPSTHNFTWIYSYISDGIYPESITDRGNKANFRRMCRPYLIKSGHLYYKKTMGRVVLTQEERQTVLKMVHCGADSSLEASALSFHRGRDATQRLLRTRYYWPLMANDV